MHSDLQVLVGNLVLRFAQLEDSLTEGFATIININYRDAQIIFGAISFNKKIQILNALLRKYYSNDSEKKIYNLLKKAKKLEDDRNRIIHSNWNYIVKTNKSKDIDITIFREKVKYNSKDQTRVISEQFDETGSKYLKKIIDNVWKCS